MTTFHFVDLPLLKGIPDQLTIHLKSKFLVLSPKTKRVTSCSEISAQRESAIVISKLLFDNNPTKWCCTNNESNKMAKLQNMIENLSYWDLTHQYSIQKQFQAVESKSSYNFNLV